MTTLLGDHIYNIEEEEYWEAYQHTLKCPYKLTANDEDEEGGAASSDDEDEDDDKSDSSSDSSSSDGGHDNDDSSTNSVDNNKSYDSPYSGDDWGEPPSDREDEDADLFYEEYDSDMDHYNEDIEDDAEANRWSDTDNDQYRLINVLENARDWSDITNVSSRFDLRYEKHGREVLELGSYYDSEPSSPISHSKEENDINAKLATLDHKLMVHSLRIMTLENAECNNERMEESDSEHLP